MNRLIMLMLGVFVAILPGPTAFAGPCAQQIDKVQSQLDAKLEAAAAGGAAGAETTGAKLHHQPTPATIGAAEEKLGDLPPESEQTAEAALARARKADAAGKKERCERDLEQARRAIGG